jgi:hypothetical protein
MVLMLLSNGSDFAFQWSRCGFAMILILLSSGPGFALRWA